MPSSIAMTFVKSYTVGLFCAALVATVMSGMHFLVFPVLLDDSALEQSGQAIMGPFLAFFYIVIAIASVTVGTLRAYRSPAARPATLALNLLWVLWVGFGTVMLLWWALRVRRAERDLESPAA